MFKKLKKNKSVKRREGGGGVEGYLHTHTSQQIFPHTDVEVKRSIINQFFKSL